MNDKALVLAVFLAGILVGYGVLATTTDTERPTTDTTPTSVSIGTGCLEQSSGWLFLAPSEKGWTVFYNQSISHAAGETVRANVKHRGQGVYEIVVRTVSSEKARTLPEDCRVGSTVDVTATLPSDYREVVVIQDGRHVTTVESAGITGPTLRRVNATDQGQEITAPFHVDAKRKPRLFVTG